MSSDPAKLGLVSLVLAVVLLSALPTGAADVRQHLAEVLVQPRETYFVPCRWDKEPALIALYFGAGWCAPCHEFVPKLKVAYEELRQQDADVGIVFVSLDRSEREMLRYMRRQQMPWPAVDFRRLRFLPELRALAGEGPPNLVLIDQSGRVLANAWQAGRYVGAESVLRLMMEMKTPAAGGRGN